MKKCKKRSEKKNNLVYTIYKYFRQRLLEEERFKKQALINANEAGLEEKMVKIESYKNSIWGDEIKNSDEAMQKINDKSNKNERI